jgi:hypothetical protein
MWTDCGEALHGPSFPPTKTTLLRRRNKSTRVEGRGYDPEGKVTFNAFGTIPFNPATKIYTLHSHAMGNVGDFVLTLAPDGYTAIHYSSC